MAITDQTIMDDLRREFGDEIARLHKTINEMQIEIDELNYDYDQLFDQNIALEAQVEDLQAELEEKGQ